MIKYISYNEKYLSDMNKLEGDYWGIEENESIEDEIDKNSIIKLAVND